MIAITVIASAAFAALLGVASARAYVRLARRQASTAIEAITELVQRVDPVSSVVEIMLVTGAATQDKHANAIHRLTLGVDELDAQLRNLAAATAGVDALHPPASTETIQQLLAAGRDAEADRMAARLLAAMPADAVGH